MANTVSVENPVPMVAVTDDAMSEPLTPVRADEVPLPKAPGPNPVPLSEVPSVEGMEGNTVHGVLLASVDLEEVGLEVLQRLNMGRAEAGEQLLKSISFEVSKGEAKRWDRSANSTLDRIHQLQSDIEWVQRHKGANPEVDLDTIVLPQERGIHEGKTIVELRILLQASNIRYSCLRDGAGFWSYIYFEQLLQPESDMASLSDLPRSSAENRLKERDALQDLLRWAIGRFARLQDVVGDLSNYLSTSMTKVRMFRSRLNRPWQISRCQMQVRRRSLRSLRGLGDGWPRCEQSGVTTPGMEFSSVTTTMPKEGDTEVDPIPMVRCCYPEQTC